MGVTAWWFSDGKVGHENQSSGLIQALESKLSLVTHRVAVPPPTLRREAGQIIDWLRGRYPPGDALPRPDLIIGAGRATQLPMLAARRARGGRAIVIMTPSLPLACFDLCIVPEHDGVEARDNVIQTVGALNRMRYSADKDRGLGFVLIGGPSLHHAWSERSLLEQVDAVVAREPGVSWVIATSRRTPEGTLAHLQERAGPRVTIVPFHQTDPDWLPTQLARAARVWVTEDSVSMVYESLSTGAATGVLAVPRIRVARVVRGLDRLVERGQVTRFKDWQSGTALRTPDQPLREAERCAEEILERWRLRDA